MRDGRAHHVLGLSIAQAARGHDVTILQPTAAALPEPVDRVRPVALTNAPSAMRFPRSRSATIRFNLTAARWIVAHRRREGVDVIHAHGDVYECAVLGPLARIVGVPLVLTIHSGLSRRRRYRVVARRLLRLPRAIIAVDEGIRDRLLEMGLPAQSVSVISSGIWYEQFRARPSGATDDGAPKIISVGRLHPVKGYEHLIAAARKIGGRMTFDVYGDGPERARLTAQSRDLRHVTFRGERAPEEIIGALGGADIFVLPSVSLPSEIEATPTAVIEAMAAGLPVICTDAGGLPRLISDGVNGLIVPERDPEALAAAIIRLAGDPALRREMGDANRLLAKQRAWDVIASRVDEVYRSVINR